MLQQVRNLNQSGKGTEEREKEQDVKKRAQRKTIESRGTFNSFVSVIKDYLSLLQ